VAAATGWSAARKRGREGNEKPVPLTVEGDGLDGTQPLPFEGQRVGAGGQVSWLEAAPLAFPGERSPSG